MDRFSFSRRFVAQRALIAVLATGTVGVVSLTDEGWLSNGLDSRPENQAGEIFTVILLLAGVAIFLYLAGAVVELITRGVVGDYLGQGRRKRAIGHLRYHTIICGFGRIGRSVAAEFALADAQYVVTDVDLTSRAAATDRARALVASPGDAAVV